jgi:hypothetical protein
LTSRVAGEARERDRFAAQRVHAGEAGGRLAAHPCQDGALHQSPAVDHVLGGRPREHALGDLGGRSFVA